MKASVDQRGCFDCACHTGLVLCGTLVMGDCSVCVFSVSAVAITSLHRAFYTTDTIFTAQTDTHDVIVSLALACRRNHRLNVVKSECSA